MIPKTLLRSSDGKLGMVGEGLQSAEKLPDGRPGIYPWHKVSRINAGFSP